MKNNKLIGGLVVVLINVSSMHGTDSSGSPSAGASLPGAGNGLGSGFTKAFVGEAMSKAEKDARAQANSGEPFSFVAPSGFFPPVVAQIKKAAKNTYDTVIAEREAAAMAEREAVEKAKREAAAKAAFEDSFYGRAARVAGDAAGLLGTFWGGRK